jgi:NAD(P)H-dependent flavin oxidoreductase YrpB (nitropropane dioxygenase family)
MTHFTGNRFTREFALDVPIVQGPMGGVAGPELVAAASNAGGLGILPVWTLSAAEVAGAVAATRRLTDRSFGVNIRADLGQLDHIQAAIDAGVSIIHLFWGNPSASTGPIHASGARLLCTVSDPDTARAALDGGATALIAQGVEAGGHVLSEMPLAELLDAVLPLAGDVPVVAAGGLADAADIAAVVALGAAGALLGTRFVATEESQAHDDYKRALLEAGPGATARSECFDVGWREAPHRHLVNDTYLDWDRAGRPTTGPRPGEGDTVLRHGDLEIRRYSVMPPQRGMTGDIRSAVLYAGTGVDRVRDCPPAAAVVRELASRL